MYIQDQSVSASAISEGLVFKLMSPDIETRLELDVHENRQTSFIAHFEPALKAGQEAQYYFRQKTRNYFPMSEEEIHKRMSARTYHIDEPFAEKSFTISCHTDRLQLVLKFPHGFEVSGEHCVVQIGKSKVSVPEEEARIKDNAYLTLDNFGGQLILTLDLPEPKTLLRYLVRWKPPDSPSGS